MDDPEEMKTQCFGGEYMGEVSFFVVLVKIDALISKKYLCRVQ
jgi:hypothetical protein